MAVSFRYKIYARYRMLKLVQHVWYGTHSASCLGGGQVGRFREAAKLGGWSGNLCLQPWEATSLSCFL
jgi:hypothetical protein